MRSRQTSQQQHPKKRYDLREQLGRGSYGSVYKAIDTVTSDVVAVKIIPLSVTEQDGFAEVKKEIEMLQVSTAATDGSLHIFLHVSSTTHGQCGADVQSSKHCELHQQHSS